jgi:low temperature requirement protein LtrA
MTAEASTGDNPPVRVSTLELFFDLVFVFTITQLADLLEHHLDWLGLAQVVLMLGVIWWMYGGYAWLTNAVAPSSTTRRSLLLTGMAGFFVIALAVPHAFGSTGWAFGVAYLVVSLVHSSLFLGVGGPSAAPAVRRLALLNLVSALLVAGGGFVPPGWRYGLWAAALAVQIATPYLHRMTGYTVATRHFTERHGLVVIIAIGESIVAIGVGIAGLPLGTETITVAVLGLCIAYYLWWAYFAGDEERAEQVLAAITEPARKARTALAAYGYAHYPMILGIVVLATGVKTSVAHGFESLPWPPAIALGAGAALFLAGHAWFLRILGLTGVVHRLAATAGVLAAILLGHWIAVAELVAVPLVMAAALIAEDIPRARRAGSSAVHTFGRT